MDYGRLYGFKFIIKVVGFIDERDAENVNFIFKSYLDGHKAGLALNVALNTDELYGITDPVNDISGAA